MGKLKLNEPLPPEKICYFTLYAKVLQRFENLCRNRAGEEREPYPFPKSQIPNSGFPSVEILLDNPFRLPFVWFSVKSGQFFEVELF